jgi:hypothetical protein
MARITDQAGALYWQEMSAGRITDSAEARWTHFERAHIVSQPDPWLHTGKLRFEHDCPILRDLESAAAATPSGAQE